MLDKDGGLSLAACLNFAWGDDDTANDSLGASSSSKTTTAGNESSGGPAKDKSNEQPQWLQDMLLQSIGVVPDSRAPEAPEVVDTATEAAAKWWAQNDPADPSGKGCKDGFALNGGKKKGEMDPGKKGGWNNHHEKGDQMWGSPQIAIGKHHQGHIMMGGSPLIPIHGKGSPYMDAAHKGFHKHGFPDKAVGKKGFKPVVHNPYGYGQIGDTPPIKGLKAPYGYPPYGGGHAHHFIMQGGKPGIKKGPYGILSPNLNPPIGPPTGVPIGAPANPTTKTPLRDRS